MGLLKIEIQTLKDNIKAYSSLPLVRLPIVLFGQKKEETSVLYQKCERIKIGKEGLKVAREVAKKMADVMRRYKKITNAGRGLAANQIGISKRIVLFMDDDGSIEIFINPKIIGKSNEKNLYWEMCISGASLGVDVVRPANVRVSWYDLKGKRRERDFSGFDARRMQHEIDHLDGKVCYNTKGTIHETLGYSINPNEFKAQEIRAI